MSDLTYSERRKLEEQFQMGGGYVLEFSNRTLAEFVAESTGRDLYDTKYGHGNSGSKANRIRAFWKLEPNHVVGKLLADLLEQSRPAAGGPDSCRLFDECLRIAERLKQGTPVEAIDAITPDGDDRGFEVLAQSVRESIERNEPEAGLDRLHTYVVRLIRRLAEKRGIAVVRDKPLHSIFGEYVKALRRDRVIESEMAERILKSDIGALEAFNFVRNEHSLAHDNPVLGYDESLLIYNHVCGAVRFLRAQEMRAGEKPDETSEAALPF